MGKKSRHSPSVAPGSRPSDLELGAAIPRLAATITRVSSWRPRSRGEHPSPSHRSGSEVDTPHTPHS
eukprot:431990-Prorocentrum_minimum.AAC.1